MFLFLLPICPSSMVLSQEEIDGCREAFLAFDKDRSGTIGNQPLSKSTQQRTT